MNPVLWLLVFVLGSAVGSFINVVADRFNTGLAWWKGSSFCFSCGEKLKFKDLFPVLSFIFLRGKCATCHSKIPKTAFLVEALMGVVSIVAFNKFALAEFLSGAGLINYFLVLSISALLVLIAVYDLRHFIIPDQFIISLSVISVLFALHNFGVSRIWVNIISAIILPLPFLLLFLISRGRWLGFGDIKFMSALGLLLGFAGGASAILLSFWIGAGFTLILLLVNRKTLTIKSEVPFGPFISVGIGVSLYFGLDILHLNDIWLLL